MNSGIDNYRRTNLNIEQKYFNPSDLYKDLPLALGCKPKGQDVTNQQIEETHMNRGQEIDPIKLYNSNTLITNNQNILSQIDLIEKDIKNIFSNNITSDRLERLGSGDIQNGMPYDVGSLNPPHQMLNKYEKPNNLIHNNVTKNVYAETLQEYTIVIDSADRDIEKYINPFSYRVKFNGLPGTKDANIMKKFDYVKYIKLDTGIIPTKYYYIKQDTSLNNANFSFVSQLNLVSNPRNSVFNLASSDVSGSFAIIDITDVSGTKYIRFGEVEDYPNIVSTVYEYQSNSINNSINNYIARYKLQSYSLANDKYTLLYIDEFQNPNENSTNDAVGKSFSIMFPDGCNCDILYTSSGFIDKMFKFSLLGQINQMTIKILNFNGNQLKNSQEDYTDKFVDKNKVCTCYTDSNGYFIRNYRCVCTYFRHPYYQKFQNTLIFRIGVIEPNIDKTIFS